MIKKLAILGLASFFVLGSASIGYSKDPEEAVKLLYKAWNAGGAEEIKLFREVIEKYPDTGCAERARRDLANAFSGRGMFEAAVREYREYIKKYPKSNEAEDAQHWIAQELFGRGRHEEAFKEYRSFLRLFPDASGRTVEHVRWRMIELEFDKLKVLTPERAIERLERIADESKYYRPQALWRIAAIYGDDLDDCGRSVVHLRRFLKEYPQADDSATALWRIAECHGNGGDIARASAGYEELAKRHAGSKLAGDAFMRLAFYGEDFEENKSYEEALKAYSSFAELLPSQGWHTKDSGGYVGYGYDREVTRRIADLHRLRGEYDKAAAAYLKVLSHDEEFLAGGFTHFDKGLRYEIDHSDLFRRLGGVYADMGMPGKAEEAHERARELDKQMSKIRKVVSAEFGGKGEDQATVSFRRIDIKDGEAIADIGVSSSPRTGCGYKVWLKKGLLGWSIKKSKRTWVI
ncbi:MAG: tetratricopeptide repeat protein [Elusimicrobiota bacterium]